MAEDTSNLPTYFSPQTLPKNVKVVVTNEGDSLKAEVTLPEDGLEFVNNYSTNDGTNETKVSLTGTKTIWADEGLTAPALNDGDYEFTISADTNGAPLPTAGTTVSNVNGKFSFDITFTKDDLGNEMSKTFEYTVTETETEGRSKPGVNIAKPHTVKVTVKDDGKGNLTAVPDGDLNFVNTYSPAAVDFGVTPSVSVTKRLDGRDLREGEFTFKLVEGDQDVATAKNAADGTVTETGFDAARGNYLILDQGDGLTTMYAHCRNVDVQEGDTVKAGEMIAAVGCTGMSTGPHLHFEVRQDGEAQNPVAYFDSAIRDTLKAE